MDAGERQKALGLRANVGYKMTSCKTIALEYGSEKAMFHAFYQLVVHQQDEPECQPHGPEAGHWKYVCVCLVTEPRLCVACPACPVCEKVWDVFTVAKQIRYRCNTLNGDGGRPTIQWKTKCTGCNKLLTP